VRIGEVRYQTTQDHYKTTLWDQRTGRGGRGVTISWSTERANKGGRGEEADLIRLGEGYHALKKRSKEQTGKFQEGGRTHRQQIEAQRGGKGGGGVNDMVLIKCGAFLSVHLNAL